MALTRGAVRVELEPAAWHAMHGVVEDALVDLVVEPVPTCHHTQQPGTSVPIPAFHPSWVMQALRRTEDVLPLLVVLLMAPTCDARRKGPIGGFALHSRAAERSSPKMRQAAISQQGGMVETCICDFDSKI